jgi:glutamate synthase domain-containing protein 1
MNKEIVSRPELLLGMHLTGQVNDRLSSDGRCSFWGGAMCRMAAIKSIQPVAPVLTLRMMQAMQKGHDNSGFAMVMQDLGGAFAEFKRFPLLSLACTDRGLERADQILEDAGFSLKFDYRPDVVDDPSLDFQRMPHYIFRNYRYPEPLNVYQEKPTREQKALILQTQVELRTALEEENQGYVYSFWPDVLTLKEIGDPRDIGTYFQLWDEDHWLKARTISAQCRQNTNYRIVRYAAHPFFLEGYTLMGNGENTFFQKNKEMLAHLHPAYVGFESDTLCFLYTLHYVCEKLGWPLEYYKHVITPLAFEEMIDRPDAQVLQRLRQSLMHLEINGPNTVVFVLPDNRLGVIADSKKLRPYVIGQGDEMIVSASEVCGVNMILPNRNSDADIYPGERETVIVDNDLQVSQWMQ